MGNSGSSNGSGANTTSSKARKGRAAAPTSAVPAPRPAHNHHQQAPPAAPAAAAPSAKHANPATRERKAFKELITGELRHYGTVRTGINKANGKKMAIKTIPKAKVSRPETMRREISILRSCDLWSIGVITYILLCGYPPFYGDTDPEIFASVRAGRYDFDSPEWTTVSAEAKDLISRLLLLDAAKRLTADEALRHPWLSGSAPSTEIALNSTIFSSLKRFTGNNKLKKAALAVIADQMTETEIVELKKQFMAIDADGNGVITVAELADALRSMGHGMIEEEVTELLKGIDIDGDGLVDYPEFLAATMKRNLANKEEYLVNAFNYFDTKRQGVITKADLVQFMGSEDQAQEVIDEVDVNGDGLISFDEFIGMMQRKGFGDESESKGGSSDDLSGSFLSAAFPTGQRASQSLCPYG
ncbi:hypothetical protein PybrP1_000506 [[Pythium] brassicae (nom. inval.)]|nr:hypothetical protein PybrP1_000506 [[Pythium] brassicae (nom. inval.)]